MGQQLGSSVRESDRGRAESCALSASDHPSGSLSSTILARRDELLYVRAPMAAQLLEGRSSWRPLHPLPIWLVPTSSSSSRGARRLCAAAAHWDGQQPLSGHAQGAVLCPWAVPEWIRGAWAAWQLRFPRSPRRSLERGERLRPVAARSVAVAGSLRSFRSVAPPARYAPSCSRSSTRAGWTRLLQRLRTPPSCTRSNGSSGRRPRPASAAVPCSSRPSPHRTSHAPSVIAMRAAAHSRPRRAQLPRPRPRLPHRLAPTRRALVTVEHAAAAKGAHARPLGPAGGSIG